MTLFRWVNVLVEICFSGHTRANIKDDLFAREI